MPAYGLATSSTIETTRHRGVNIAQAERLCVYLCYLASLVVNIHKYVTIIMSIDLLYASVSTSVRWGQEWNLRLQDALTW